MVSLLLAAQQHGGKDKLSIVVDNYCEMEISKERKVQCGGSSWWLPVNLQWLQVNDGCKG